MKTNFPVIKVVANGASITTSGTSASATIPNDSTGTRASFVRITTTVAAYVKIGSGAQTAVTTSMLVNPEHELIVDVHGNDTIAAIQVAAAGVVNIIPIEF